jgi:hypothetical protein
MAFAGAATGAPAQPQQSAQSQQSALTPIPGSVEGQKRTMRKLGVTSLQAVPGRQVEKDAYKAVQIQLSAKQGLLTMGTDRVVPDAQRPAALNSKAAPAGLNATAAATADQPIVGKDLTTLSRTGVNAWQQETFSAFGTNLEPPDPTVCAGNNFAVQVVNAQVQISDVNLNKLTAPISLEAFFGDFFRALNDPQCVYNHSTGKWYISVGVTDGVTMSGVYIATSTSSDPRSPYNFYFLDLGFEGGDGACAAGLCLADSPKLGADQYTVSISTNQFDISGAGNCVSGFCGAVFVLMDKVAMSLGFNFPTFVVFDISNSPPPFDFVFPFPPGFDCINGLGPCWSSIAPADASNGRYDTRQGGTTWAMSSLDFFGGGDNRIAVWQFNNTQTISAFLPDINMSSAFLDIGHNTYTDPPFAAQPQTATGPGVANGNPLGDFLVIIGLCSSGTPPVGCSNPGPIQTNDARIQDATLTKVGANWIMWGGLNTDATAAGLCTCPGTGGHVGIMLFGVNLGPLPLDDPDDTTSLANVWTIHNPANDVYNPAVALLDNGLTLASYGVSGPSLRPSAAYSVFSSTLAPSSIKIANQGLGVQDGFTQYNCVDSVDFLGTCGDWRPRYGDVSGAATMLNHVFFTTEYIADSNCSLAQFVTPFPSGTTCGPSQTVPNAQKRTFFANWGTSLDRASPANDHTTHTDPHHHP